MVKKVLLVVALILSIATVTEGISTFRFYRKLVKAEKIGEIRECWTPQLLNHPEILESKGDSILIEKCIYKCVDEERNGVVLGIDPPYNYIRCAENMHTGDVGLAVFIYSPDAKYLDDIVDRFDYIIDSHNHSHSH